MTVDKCNNAYYRIINMKKAEIKSITLVKKLMVRLRNLKLGILIEYQNIEIFCKRLCSKLV